MTGWWQPWLGSYTGIAFLAMAALPVAAYVACSRARSRIEAGDDPPYAWRRSVTEVALVHGTVPWVWMTLLPGSHAGEVGSVSLVPLRDLATMPVSQVLGNLLVLAALGFFGPMRFAGLASLGRVVVLAAACSMLIEAAQFVLRLDRVSSVDDVLLNTLGAAIAAFASRSWWFVDRTPARSYSHPTTT